MARRAVIYVRTSSESQGEKSSSIEQEADCKPSPQPERGVDRAEDTDWNLFLSAAT